MNRVNLGLVFIILLGISCQKEFSSELNLTSTDATWANTTPSIITHPARLHLNGLVPNSVSYNFDNAVGTFIFMPSTQIRVPNNCFVKMDNSTITGNVDIKITLANKFSEMIFHNLATVTNNSLLSTDGMIKIEAKQNTDALKIAAGKTVDISFLKSSPNVYQGFIGVTNNTTVNNVSWNLNSNWQTDTTIFFNPIPGLTLATRIRTDSLTWVNCDYFYNQPNPTNIYLKLPNGFGNANTVCYGVIKADKVLLGLQPDMANKQFWQGSSYKVPTGKVIKLVAICRKDNKTYYGVVETTIGTNTIATITLMDEVTDTDLQTRLNAL